MIRESELSLVYSRSCEGNIAELRDVFRGCPDSLFVRGSLVRGDISPYSDIDVSAYNPGGGYRSKNLPPEFRGIPFTYGSISLEKFENFFETCPRAASSLMESVEINLIDQEPLEIIKRQRQKFLEKRADDYILFLLAEEQIFAREEVINGETEAEPNEDHYERYKRFKLKTGGRRTVSRIIWITKCLHPEFCSNLNSRSLLTR